MSAGIEPSSLTQSHRPFPRATPNNPSSFTSLVSVLQTLCPRLTSQSLDLIFHILPPCLFSCTCPSVLCMSHLSFLADGIPASLGPYFKVTFLTCSLHIPGTHCARPSPESFTHLRSSILTTACELDALITPILK